MQPLHLFEININYFIQSFRTPMLDNFFLFLNYFDTWVFSVLIILILWAAYDWKWGIRIFYFIVFNAIVNHLLKSLFAIDRPFTIDPSIALLDFKSYSFPSGGAQSAMLFAVIIIKTWKNVKALAWTVASLLVFGIGISRIYLGAHFLSDVLVGFVVGYLVALLLFMLSRIIEKEIKKNGMKKIFPAVIVFVGAMFIIVEDSSVKMMSVAMFGLTLGLILSEKYDALISLNKKFIVGFLRTVFYISTLIIVFYMATTFFKDFPKYNLLISIFCISIWLSFAAGFIWKRMFKNLIDKLDI